MLFRSVRGEEGVEDAEGEACKILGLGRVVAGDSGEKKGGDDDRRDEDKANLVGRAMAGEGMNGVGEGAEGWRTHMPKR